VLQVDTPERLYNAPKSRAVASFVGNMNFFCGEVKKADAASCEIEAEGLGRVQVNPGLSKYAPGERVFLAMRPEKLTVSMTKPPGSRGTARGVVDASIYLGERRNFYVSIQGKDKPLAVSCQNEVLLGTSGIGQGCHVWVSWNDESLVVLDGN